MQGSHLFKSLSVDKLEKLMSVFTLQEIGEIFNVSKPLVSGFISEALKRGKETNKSIYDGVPLYFTVGAMQELKNTEMYKYLKM